MDEIYYERKIDKWLNEWKNKPDHAPALIIGIRQCGKTDSIKNFAYKNYKNLIYINFWTNPDYINQFKDSLDVDHIISNLSLYFPNEEILPKETLIFLDEIQECPRARLFFKDAAIDGRYEIIGSGSFLGINGYIEDDATPTPMGYEDVFQMKTMDFEEFLRAYGYKKEQIEELLSYFYSEEKIPDSIHNIYKKRFNEYLCVGGYPKAVKSFLKNHNLMEGIKEVNINVNDLKLNFGRRLNKNGEPIFKTNEVARIKNAFELIPTFLGKENKRYVVSKINGGNGDEKKDALSYLEQCGIIYKVYNVSEPSIPLKSNIILNQYKIFPCDIGILTSLLGIETIQAINNNDLSSNKGAIYEALVFDSLYKNDVDIYYFAKESGLELDFLISYKFTSTILEVKAKSGNAKSAKTVLLHPEHYGKTTLIKIGDYNIGKSNGYLTIPHYLSFAIKKDLIEFKN